MQLTTLLTIAISALPITVTATPTPTPQTDATAAAATKTQLIDLWQNTKFLGLKFTGSSTVGTCENLKGTGFNNVVSSGKAKPGFRCTVWVEEKCLGTGFSFDVTGSDDLPGWIDDKSSSWKCVKA